MRIIADTNTLVSGFGWGGPPGQVVDTPLSGQVTLVTSPALLGELARVLAYPKLTAVFDDPAALVAAVAEAADTVDPAEHVTVLADEPDNRVLEAAAAGRAGLIVAGDKPCRNSAPSRASPPRQRRPAQAPLRPATPLPLPRPRRGHRAPPAPQPARRHPRAPARHQPHHYRASPHPDPAPAGPARAPHRAGHRPARPARAHPAICPPDGRQPREQGQTGVLIICAPLG
jgi:putative PIN family toxin of toxin-antitoxin system